MTPGWLFFALTACLPTLEEKAADTSTSFTCMAYQDDDGDGYGQTELFQTVSCDEAPSGWSFVDGDCDDSDAAAHPDAVEVCDGSDQDCDGDIDEDVTEAWYLDGDGDGYGAGEAAWACEAPENHVAAGSDCDDADPAVHPDAEVSCTDDDANCDGVADNHDGDGDGYAGCEECDDTREDTHPDADETCDEADQDCDGVVDEAPVDGSTFYADADGDGFGDSGATETACSASSGYVGNGDDCDDERNNVSPDSDETCDTLDNDCDGTVDEEATDATTWYGDADGDGYGGSDTTLAACDQPDGYSASDDDCDDADADYNPGAEESCTETEDLNCDGSVGYTDADGDGYAACAECDDSDPSVNPDADETCNDRDDDCDGQRDEDATDASTWYEDADLDGYGSDEMTRQSCTSTTGYIATGGDCDDTSSLVNPGAPELCDGYDNNCDGSTDGADATNPDTWFEDGDGDGYGDGTSTTDACDLPSGYTDNYDDCDDTDGDIHPDADEVCDGYDNDCDGRTDGASAVDATTWYADDDGDGYGTTAADQVACEQPSGYVGNSEDCFDTDAAVHPDADESCDNIDEDCDGTVDEDAVDGSTYYADDDGDGFGDPDAAVVACRASDGESTNDDDCDDTDADISPVATESCDGVDQDCDGTADNGYADADSDGDADCVDICPVYADTSGVNGDGREADPYGSIEDAIDLRGSYCDEILLLPGTYVEDVDYGGEDLAISSTDGAESTIIEGTGVGAVITVDNGESSNALLDGVTVTGGVGNRGDGSYLDSSLRHGGGIYVNGADITLSALVVEANSATGNGGGVVLADWDGSLSDSVIEANDSTLSSYSGGGLALVWASGEVFHNDFVANEASTSSGDGAGLYAWGSDTAIGYNWFEDNETNEGTGEAARLMYGSTLFYNNVLIDHAAGYALAVTDADASWIVNNTFDNNEGGIYATSNTYGPPTGSFLNNQITNSDEVGVYTYYVSFGYFAYNNVYGSGDTSYEYDWWYSDFGSTSSNYSSDPQYADRVNDDYDLTSSSPHKDAGYDLEHSLGYDDDHEGNTRTGSWAIGAYEE